MRRTLPVLFDELSRLMDLRDEWHLPALSQSEATGLSLYEDEEHIYVEAAVPGVPAEQIHISVEKGVVWIKGELNEEKKGTKIHFQSSRSYSYRLPLPARIDEQLTPVATCKDGILSVKFAKSKSAKPMRVPVTV